MTILDQYLLARSTPFDLAMGAENQTNLVLTPNPNVDDGIVAGTVTTGTTPVSGAVVKLLTPAGDPVAHALTNAQGGYVLPNIPPASYQIVAIATGYNLSAPVSFTLSPRQTRAVNVSLTADPRAVQNTVYGLVRDQTTNSRIAGASVVLTDTSGATVSTTTTNADGQYLLPTLDNGSYLLTASKAGYEAGVSVPVTLTGSQIVAETLFLTPSVAVQGTIQGFIRDSAGVAIAGAIVGLYSVVGSVETLVRTKFTNASGLYLFGDVPAGRYLVKAKLETGLPTR